MRTIFHVGPKTEPASLSRRSFISKIAGAATVAATPVVALPITITNAQTVALTESAVPSRFDRLNALFGELKRLVASEFPEFEIWSDILPSETPSPSGARHMAFIATRPSTPAMRVIEYKGPGLYEMSLSAWRETDKRVQRLEKAPKGHRHAGQFRYRFPHAPAHSGWRYAPESEFRLIQPAKL